MNFLLKFKFIIFSLSIIFPDMAFSQEDTNAEKVICFPRRWKNCGKSQYADKEPVEPISQFDHAKVAQDVMDDKNVGLIYHEGATENGWMALKTKQTVHLADSQFLRPRSVSRKLEYGTDEIKDSQHKEPYLPLLKEIAALPSIPTDSWNQKVYDIPEKDSSYTATNISSEASEGAINEIMDLPSPDNEQAVKLNINPVYHGIMVMALAPM